MGEQLGNRRADLEAGEVDPDADVRSGREREVADAAVAVQAKSVGLGEGRRIVVGSGQRKADKLARGDPGTLELEVPRRVAVEERRRGL